MISIPRLYPIADANFGDPVKLANALFEGGARFIQLRNKNATSRELLRQVEAVLKTAPEDARIIVNDRADVALISGASGVHLGQSDLPPDQVRNILGPSPIIGWSTHDLSQALLADNASVDYIAVGPIFPTMTKTNADPAIGLEGLRAICSRVRKPVVAIGGIRMETAPEVLRCGASAVAVIRDLLNCSDVAARTREWLREIAEC